MLKLTDLIIRLQPFAPQLKKLCIEDADFSEALKINSPERFISLGTVMLTRSPLVPKDEIIGVYTYDYGLQNPKFKQDFIANIGGNHTKYILYTNNPKGSKKNVRGLKDFYNKYSQGIYYKETHHIQYACLPELVKPRAIRSMELANRIQKAGGVGNIPYAYLVKLDKELRALGL